MKRALAEFFRGVASLWVGLGVTLEQFFRPTVTVHYPRQTLPLPERYRGHIVLVRDPQTGRSRCIACKACEKACPSDCILVEGIKREGEKRKSATEFKLDFTKCSLCAACVEVCPVDALAWSKAYNLASTTKEAFARMDLLQLLEQSAAPGAAPGPPGAPGAPGVSSGQ